MSIEYYSKLERGAFAGASASVLDAIARALQLDDAERAHLCHLAHAADGTTAGMCPRCRPAKHFHHQVAGQLELAYESADMISERGLTLTIYTAEPRIPNRTRPRHPRLLGSHPNHAGQPPTELG